MDGRRFWAAACWPHQPPMRARADPACLWLTQGNLLNVMKGGPQKAIDFFAFDLFKARPPSSTQIITGMERHAPLSHMRIASHRISLAGCTRPYYCTSCRLTGGM